MQGQPILGATAWKTADFSARSSFSIMLDAAERAAAQDRLAALATAQLAESAVEAAHVRHPAIEALVRRIRRELT
ncbi:MAG: hypothetical protein ACREC3_00190, partial [Methyloceanibacter sp.]